MWQMMWLMKMKRIVSISLESRLSTLSGETAVNNADNIWLSILNSCWELNLTQILLSTTKRKLKCFQYKKGIYCCWTTSATMSMKPIQIPSAPIKQRESLTYHQVKLCTLLHARWNRTTEFCNSPSLAIPDPGPTETNIDIHWYFARTLLKVDRSNNRRTGSTFV